MHLISTIIPRNHGGHSSGSPPTPGGNSLLSIVRRVSSVETGQVSTGIGIVEENIKQSIAGCSTLGSVEQFSTRLNSSGRLIGLDLTGLNEPYVQTLKQTLREGCLFEEYCDPVDRAKFRKHFLAALKSDGPTGTVYSMTASPFRIHVKFAKFSSASHDPSDVFVNAVHSIIVVSVNA